MAQWLLCRPDPSIVRRDREHRFLKPNGIVQVQTVAMELLHVVTADRKPKRHNLIAVAGVHGHECVSRVERSCEAQDASRQVSVPVIKEEIRAATKLRPLPPDPEELPDQRDECLSRLIIGVVPTQRSQQSDTSCSIVRQKVILSELFPLPQHGNTFTHQCRNQIGLKSIPAAAVTLQEQWVARLIRIDEAEVTQKPFVIVVFNILQRRFGNNVVIGTFLFCVTKEAEGESVLGQLPAIASRHSLRPVVGAILPSAVRIGRTEDFFGSFELLGALNQPDGRAGSRRKTIPIGLMECNLVLGESVGVEDQIRVADTQRAVPIIRHAVVANAVDVIDLQPMVIDAEEIVPGELPGEVGALAEIAEIVLGEGPIKGFL